MIKILGMVGQWLAVFLCGYGIVIMYTNFPNLATFYITVGALTLTIATKIRYYGEVWIEKRNKKLDDKEMHKHFGNKSGKDLK